jgi:hypothetical protein
MAKIIRAGNAFSVQIVTSLAIYSCAGARDPQREQLLRTAMSAGALMRMGSVRREVHAKSIPASCMAGMFV